MTPDFILQGGGSVYLLCPQTQAAQEWLDDNIGDEAQFLGHNLAVEHRYVEGVISGIQGDGLVVQS